MVFIPRKARKASSTGYYHVVIKGNGGQIIFEEDADRERFLRTLGKYIREEPFEILAYCLMDNHVHLLMHAEHDLDRIMKRITCSYAYYFNTKYERTGHLFQDRYRSEPIEDERYLLTVIRYIHNNPQKAGISRREDYLWSSWREYLGRETVVSTELILRISGGRQGFLRLSKSADDAECMDISEKQRLRDQDAAALAEQLLGVDNLFRMQKMEREERDRAVRILKIHGLPVRQIARLTGITRAVVSKA